MKEAKTDLDFASQQRIPGWKKGLNLSSAGGLRAFYEEDFRFFLQE